MSLSPRATISPLMANLICMASMFVWAAALPAADLLIGKVPPATLTAARTGIAALSLLPVWAMIEGPHALVRANWLRGILVGLAIGGGALFLVIGQAATSAVTVAVISATLPIFGIGAEILLDGRRLTWPMILGGGLSLVGGVITLDQGSGDFGIGLGALACLTSVILFTLGSRMTVTSFPDLTPLGRTTITLSGAAIATGVMAVGLSAFGGPAPDWAQIGAKEWIALVAFAVGGLSISQILWIVSVEHLGIGTSSLHINMAPFYVMLITFSLGGAWDWMLVLGAVVVGLGVLIAQGIIGPRSQVRT